jgi:uncharacterized membrane protein
LRRGDSRLSPIRQMASFKNEPMKEGEEVDGHSKDRIAALTDGIYSVAMTLLVIDLKLPDGIELRDSRELAHALIALEPKLTTWANSFFVLVLFYMANLRSMRSLRALDGPLAVLYMVQLALVSLMPFSTALIGEYRPVLLSQVVYSLNMGALAVISLMVSLHITRHPSLVRAPLSPGATRAGQLRAISVLAISAAAVPIAMIWSRGGQTAFLLMLLVIPLTKRLEKDRPSID